MKIIAILLSIYFLGLNFTPCNDADTIANNINNEVFIADFDNSPSHDSSDLCSPFCQCACCHINTIDFGNNTFESIVKTISSKIYYQYHNLGKEISNSVLQPPRV